MTTASDSFNVFKPNLDPDDDYNRLPEIYEDQEMFEEESKEVSTSSEPTKKKIKPSADVW